VPAETVIFGVVDDVGVQEMITSIQSLGLTVVSELVTRLVVEHHHRPLNPGELGSRAHVSVGRSASGPAGAAIPATRELRMAPG